MKEQIHTIPISDAMANAGECPFCYIERKVEERTMDFVLGASSSYMEADIRDMTDRAGFCRSHFKKMFDYGNTLGNAWILKTLLLRQMGEMDEEFRKFKPDAGAKKGLFHKEAPENAIVSWIEKREETCFICDGVKKSFQAYLNTFMTMYKKDDGFRRQVAETEGFCLSHFKLLLQAADTGLKGDERKEFYEMVLPLMQKNYKRVFDDVAWFVEKNDYKNKDADWKTSRDAIQRGMQKIRGGDPSLPPYKAKL